MSTKAAWIRVLVPLSVPALFVLIPIVGAALVVGLAVTIAVTRIVPAVRAAHSRTVLVAGRIAIGVVAFALLPGAITDIHDVIVRDDAAAALRRGDGR